ncbi:GNAT family N-acetyltransferase [Lysobacter sp. 5GHs7-4]|uniref:GNAT family N-acetyltransferase n=1 Tax=Lysobacter sp. 5GHs7-4 TaxID=2904253 RepID=UPI001E4E7893|nr:GNAT family N-acetyltransferase [Lysobacter sp. 5GHs7-4]UHQ23441.1 GNAT family N-acetyltransferase [Lysobacter sp. 5GHs7-4]
MSAGAGLASAHEAARVALALVPAAPHARAAQPDDLPALLELCAEHAQHTAFERLPYGHAHDGLLELREALFEPPLRAWAWIAYVDGAAVGYASATVGFSLLERAYHLCLESLYVRAAWRERAVETLLFEQALDAAARFGCLNLQWQAPAWSEAARALDLPRRATRMEAVRYVLPVQAGHGDV